MKINGNEAATLRLTRDNLRDASWTIGKCIGAVDMLTFDVDDVRNTLGNDAHVVRRMDDHDYAALLRRVRTDLVSLMNAVHAIEDATTATLVNEEK